MLTTSSGLSLLFALLVSLCFFNPPSVFTSAVLPVASQVATELSYYVSLQTAQANFLNETELEARGKKVETAFRALDSLAYNIYNTIPGYLHASLPHTSYLQAASGTIYGYNAHLHPKTPREITSAAEKMFASELLYSADDSDDRQGLRKIIHNLRDHVEWIHALKKTDLLLMTDDEGEDGGGNSNKYIRTYEQLYEKCVMGNLEAILKL